METKTTGKSLALGFILAASLEAVAAGEATGGRPDDSYSGYWYVSLGGFDGAEVDSLGSSGGGDGLSAGYGLFVRRNLAVEIEASLFGTEYDLPPGIPPGVADGLTLDTSAVLVNAKLFRRFGIIEPFVSAGLGVGIMELSVDDESLYYYEPLEDESTLLGQLTVGMDFRIKERHRLGLSFRRFETFDDFDLFGEEADAGGNSVLLSYRANY